jgi:hypothetical protein
LSGSYAPTPKRRDREVNLEPVEPRVARLCLDCDEIHGEQMCPVCRSESFGYVSRWIRCPSGFAGTSEVEQPNRESPAPPDDCAAVNPAAYATAGDRKGSTFGEVQEPPLAKCVLTKKRSPSLTLDTSQTPLYRTRCVKRMSASRMALSEEDYEEVRRLHRFARSQFVRCARRSEHACFD